MKITAIISLISALTLQPTFSQEKEGQAKAQLAILLDTSSSMSGLIDQTKSQLWKVVNTFIDAKQNGEVPYVEVALYEYGNNGITDGENWIRCIQPLSRDLDQISEELFGLTTSGGDEFCGAVIQKATIDLKWDASPDVYKAIFIAGNEAFTQGPVKAELSCKEAIAKGIIVNTIHCGEETVGIDSGWKSGALLADGSFLNINQNAAVAHIESPQDDEIVKLNEKLNKTYIAYGETGRSKLQAQSAQDSNALKKEKSGAAVNRAVTKSSTNYWNSSWDLGDASKAKDFDWNTVKEADLPEDLKKLDLEARKKYVADKLAERTKVREEIQKLNEARKVFVAEKRKESAKEGETTLDVAVTNTVREQAIKKGYQFEK